MLPVVYTGYGRKTELPFKLLRARPVYCRDGSNQIGLGSQYFNG